MTELIILSHEGDTTLTWDDNDPAAREEMRQTVADLAVRGYSFFLTDGRPADAVTAGGGTLIVRKLRAEEVVEPPPPAGEPEPAPADTAKRRGRKGVPRKTVVATRPIAGG